LAAFLLGSMGFRGKLPPASPEAHLFLPLLLAGNNPTDALKELILSELTVSTAKIEMVRELACVPGGAFGDCHNF
jgi:hypothetical protein